MHACYKPRKSKAALIAGLNGDYQTAKVVSHNTVEYLDRDGNRKVRFHDTDILAFPEGGGFTLDTGGWNTHTTRDRLNQHLPAGWYVCTDKGVLRLGQRGGPSAPVLRTATVDDAGAIHSDLSADDVKAVRRKIDAYLRAWRKEGLPRAEDSLGDPWCVSPDWVDEETMKDWVETKYIHRRLYILALQNAHVSDQGILLYLRMADHNGLQANDYARIRRFVRRKLGLG